MALPVHVVAAVATILVVDDIAENLSVLGELLQPTYRVLAANSGRRALALATADPTPDLILLDVMMPGMDGYSVLTRLKAEPATREIPVIFVTAMDAMEDEQRGLDLGAVDYITKPLRPPIVLARVRTQLELKRMRDWLRDENAVLEAEVARRVAENELILAGAAEGIVGTDARGTITFVNPAAAAMLGYAAADLHGRELHASIHHQQCEGRPYPAEDCPLYAAFAAGAALNNKEEFLRRKNGDPLPVELSWTPSRLEGQTVGAVLTFTDITERKRYLAQLERQSNYDELTGLPNRNLLRDRLAQAVGRSRDEGRSLVVLVLNLDRFKEYNDTLGRDAADLMLQNAAQRLGQVDPRVDTVARVAGDEFVVLANGDTAETLPHSIRKAFSTPFAVAGHEYYLSCAIGIAVFPKDGEDAESLLKNAATAMYRAKAAGGDGFGFYAAEMNARSRERLELENDLRRALERDELVLHYQPQLNLRNGGIIGCEALIRWQHPQRGLLPPGDFIPLAEATGLIVPIGEWVMYTACRQNKSWQAAGQPPVTMAVNVSAHQFSAGNVVDLAASVLRETGLQPDKLELELTGSAVMAGAEDFIQTMAKLKGLRITLSIDDFGTGFSSLRYLKRFAVDRLKIDQSFVQDITQDPNSTSIALAIMSLAHSLNMSVIAEGVETEAQLNFLRSRGCDAIQGFYFAKPVPAAEFEQMLRERRKLSFASDATVPGRTLLLVDDEPGILSSLKRLLRREGYCVLTAESGREGLEKLASQEVGVVLSDARMPEMGGAEFLGKVREMYPESVRLMLSGYTDLKAVTDAVNKGELFKFLTKPWNDDELLMTIRDAFRHFESRRQMFSNLPETNRISFN